VTWTFDGAGAVNARGEMNFAYEPNTLETSGSWLLRPDGTGTFRSTAEDGSGTLTIDRRDAGP